MFPRRQNNLNEVAILCKAKMHKLITCILRIVFKDKTTHLSEIDTLKEEVGHQKEEITKTIIEKVNIRIVSRLCFKIEMKKLKAQK